MYIYRYIKADLFIALQTLKNSSEKNKFPYEK